ncbi:uncharacterized protein LOC122503226 [Leptopilina heterotoma]|uniref:uncharacterized protein LOC122503226 n=1 Tax=Leptopilina heterotoma TaxID=63436 RepID=UPI001CA97461|nr:uncharacterized protein LOC122503226 [Leptopilina heterotoma]
MEDRNEEHQYTHNGHHYVTSKILNGKVYLICRFHRTKRCNGRANFFNGLYKVTTKHTHKPDARFEQEKIFKEELRRARITQTANSRVIYNQIRPFHENASIGVPFESVRSLMNVWERRNVPQTPHSLEEYATILNSDRYENGTLRFIPIFGGGAVVIVDPEYMSLVTGSGDFYIHISDKSSPQDVNCHHLMTIMCFKNTYVLPCAWALLNSTDEDNLTGVLVHLKEVVPDFEVRKLVSSYNSALQSSARRIFPAAVIVGSLHGQSSIRSREGKWHSPTMRPGA